MNYGVDHIEISDSSGYAENITESVEELRARLNTMKKLIAEEGEKKKNNRRPAAGDSIIDGSFLSLVFTLVLVLIIAVSGYAFLNLYYAILKKFPTREHTEL